MPVNGGIRIWHVIEHSDPRMLPLFEGEKRTGARTWIRESAEIFGVNLGSGNA